MRGSARRKREEYEKLAAEDPEIARLWVALEARPRPPQPFQRVRWIADALDRYQANPSEKAFARYADVLIRHLGEEAAVSFIERGVASARKKAEWREEDE